MTVVLIAGILLTTISVIVLAIAVPVVRRYRKTLRAHGVTEIPVLKAQSSLLAAGQSAWPLERA